MSDREQRRVVFLADAPYIHTRRWVRHFVERGWETHLISFRPAAINGSSVHYIDGFERLGKLRYLLHARRVRRLVRELRPDVVHALHLTSYGFLAALAGVRPLMVSVWGTDILQAPRLSPLHGLITRYALRRADRITATGERLAQATRRYVPPGRPVIVVPYGVDLDLFNPHPRDPRDDTVIGSVGRLSSEKGLEYLLRAASIIAREEPRVRVLLAGDGPDRHRLERLSSRLDLEERVEFVGEVEHDRVPEVLARLDVFVMPSTWEGFGVAALEAEAMGLPVVASAVHGIPDVVENGVTGLLVPPRNVDALAQALLRLVQNETLRQQMGRAGREFVASRYDWSRNAAQMESLYEELLAPH